MDTVTAPFYAGSAMIRLRVNDKLTGKLLDRIVLIPAIWTNWYYDEFDCNDATSYSTGFNADRTIYNNYFGTVVIADLNFDGKDDIALVNGSAATSGPFYTFYIQNDDGKFKKDYFLSDEMMYFPNEIDSLHRQLTTYAHSSSVEMCKRVYQLDSITNKWKCINRKFIRY